MAKPENVNRMSLTVAASRVVDFQVEAYTYVRKMTGPGESFQSDTFMVGGYNWAVRFSPMLGVSLKLVLLSEPTAVDDEGFGVKFAVTMLDKLGKESAEGQSKCLEFFYKGQEEGFIGLMSEKDLAKFIRADCFVVRCTISILRRPRRH